jgi:hypothetical protein
LLICSTLLLHLSTSCLTSNLIINLELQLKVSKGTKYNCTHLFCNHLQKHEAYTDSWTSIHTPCCRFFQNSAYLICQNI